MTRLLFASFLLLSITFVSVDALKILVISPVFGRSHMQLMGKLADLYASNGHEVVFFEPEIISNEPILTFEPSKLARVIKKKKSWESPNAFHDLIYKAWTVDHNKDVGMAWLTDFMHAVSNSCRDILSDEILLKKLRDEQFDIGVAEYLTVCPYALYRKIGIQKYITVSATPLGAGFGMIFGIPAIPSLAINPEFITVPYEPASFMFRLSNVMTFIRETVTIGDLFMNSIIKTVNEHYPDMDLENVITNSSYVFINANEHIEFVKPQPLKYVNIAGIGVPKAKPLPEDYQKFMDGAKDGVILISFGSSPLSMLMPPVVKQSFLNAFDNFPKVKFILKHENSSDNIAAGHSNVLTRQWIPQVDIMNHKNLIGFISHGGMNSLIESSVYGVPTICIALFGDQTRNCLMSQNRGISIPLNKMELTTESITNALRELIQNKKYLNKARSIGKMIKKAPMSAEDRVIKYTNFAAEFDVSESLDDPARKLNMIQFYNLDVFGLFFLAALVVLVACFVLIKKLFSLVRCVLKCCKSDASKPKSE
ncbi:UDP-glucuronosyltransferase [Aphelenchoides bicaudatus]|nr:UDP-glucuronosyltransferase [Aphelenchoides bicaudatus]